LTARQATAILITMKLPKFRLFLGAYIIALWLLFLTGPALCFAQEDFIKIHFINVGQGDAVLIQSQGENALIDTGNALSGYKLVDYLKNNNAAAINHLIVTHHHPDHILGAFFIMPRFKVEKTYDNGYDLASLEDSILSSYEKIFRLEGKYRALKEGDIIKLGGLKLEILWPADKPSSEDFNYGSLVIMLSYKNFRCLLAGDINNAAEAELMKKKINLSADILKIAHHGAGGSTSEDFLKEVKPKLAIISVDNGFQRKYPAESTLALLKAKNVKTYRTDRNGSIIIKVDNKGNYTLSAEK